MDTIAPVRRQLLVQRDGSVKYSLNVNTYAPVFPSYSGPTCMFHSSSCCSGYRHPDYSFIELFKVPNCI